MATIALSSSPPRSVRRRTLSLAALSGLVLVASFPHLDLGWLAWAALVPFLLTFPHANVKIALAHGIVMGLVFFGGLMYWIGVFAARPVGPLLGVVAWLGAALSMTAFLVLFALGAHWLHSRPRRQAWIWGIPALWTALEWTRQFGILGTTWGDLAFTQHNVLPLLQVTKLAGPWGLTFLIVLGNVALAECLTTRKLPRAPLFLIMLALAYGLFALHTEQLRPSYAAAALQGNINQDVPLTPAYVQSVLAAFTAQSAEAKSRGASLTVWPETAVPGFLRSDPTFAAPIARIAAQNNQTLLVGALGYDAAQKKDSNSLFLVTPQGLITGSYAKRRLVPFGEYVPLRAQFPMLERLHLSVYDMAPGAERQPLLYAPPPIGPIGAAICYDSTYAGLMREQAARGAQLLIVTTDDTWFGRTAAAYQHANMAALDAAACDRYLVRCAATGISQIFDPTGRVIATSQLFRPAVVSARVQSRTTQTFYVRHGDWFVGLCAVILALTFWPSARGRRAGTARNSAP